jgi:hypothetical protein
LLAILVVAPFNESEQLGSHNRLIKLMSKPVSPNVFVPLYVVSQSVLRVCVSDAYNTEIGELFPTHYSFLMTWLIFNDVVLMHAFALAP